MSHRTNIGTINAALTASVARRQTIPALPDLRTLATGLRELNANYEDGGAEVWLYCQGAGWPDAHWVADHGNLAPAADRWPGSDHFEWLPGEGKPFDSTAAARRLLSEARLAGFK